MNINQLMFIANLKNKSCIYLLALDICSGPALHLPLGFYVITRFFYLELNYESLFLKSPKNSKFDIRSSSYSKHFNIKAEKKENFSRGVRKLEPICFDLNKTKLTERLRLFFPPSPSPSTPTDPADPSQ